MFQYLLNTTAIWLMSLVLFDVFLRRESYHRYNRFFLLFTFVLGALFPLVHWQDNSRLYPASLEKPIAQIITAKQTVMEATTVPAAMSWQQWIVGAYLLGMAVALALLLIEIVKLVSCYRSGKRSQAEGWAIVETGKEHAPFSFLGTLFVCSTAQYSGEEWRMILIHEKRHHSLLHFADLLLMQVARIVFWFHPLVYIYNKRLLLVHEYQADKAATQQPQLYGRFLVEQAMLQAAPAISHSFNRSPIKNRIVMLTRRSSVASRTKMLVFLPLLMVCFMCFSKNGFSKKPVDKNLFIFPFGIQDTALKIRTTYDQVLKNPIILCSHNCEIIDFTISFLPKGKDFYGPFETKGSKVKQQQIDFIKLHKEEKNEKFIIYVENIHVKVNGVVKNANTKILICEN